MKDDFLAPETKNLLKEITLSYQKKRESSLQKQGFSKKELQEKARSIRQKTFENFEKNFKEALENLEKRGFIVHLVQDSQEAQKRLLEIIENERAIVKSKSNVGREVGINQLIKEISSQEGFFSPETDLGDFLVDIMKEEDLHYVLPALHIDPEDISRRIKTLWQDEVAPDPQELTSYLCQKIRGNILRARIGISGVNFFTRKGECLLLENEGNISLISRLPQKHIMIGSVDKLVSSLEEGIFLCQAAAIFGTGQEITQYISVINGPSKTADIQNELVVGAQGAKEVHLILVDNGRTKMIESGFKEALLCIGCGACLNFCSVYHQMGNRYGGDYIGSRGIVMKAFQKNDPIESLKAAKEGGSFNCTLCGVCHENCPLRIDLPALVRKVREKQHRENIQTSTNQEMIEKVTKTGNPFGEKGEDQEIPDKLFCC